MSKRREQLVPGRPNTIVFETYVCSGDDVTVHIDVHSEDRLKELEIITRKLSAGELKTFRFSELDDAHWVPPLSNVVLMNSDRGSDVRNYLRGEHLVCEWRESTEGWLESAEKIAAMRVSVMPCHQYFEGPHANSVTIELAYLE